jgi:hypothetical protein
MNSEMKALALMMMTLGLVLAGCGGGGGNHAPARTAPVRARSHAPKPLVLGYGRKVLGGIRPVQGARFLSPTRLLVVTFGSGSCPALPNDLVVLSPHAIRIHLAQPEPPGRSCTSDLRGTPVIVAIDPKRVDVHQPVTLRLYYYRSKRAVFGVVPALRA